MPAHRSSHSVIARNEITGKYEKIHLSKSYFPEIDDRKKKAKAPTNTKAVSRPQSLLERIEGEKEYQEDLEFQRTVGSLIAQRNLLEKKIAAEKAKVKLANRIAPPVEIPDAPFVPKFKFQKKSITQRRDKHVFLLERTSARLGKLEDDYKNRDDIPATTRTAVDILINRFADAITQVHSAPERITNAQWRHIKADCKAVGRVKFKVEGNRTLERILNDLKSLKLQFVNATYIGY